MRSHRELQQAQRSAASLAAAMAAPRIVTAAPGGGYCCAERMARERWVSASIAVTSSATESNFSCPRKRATMSTATCWPYRSAVVSKTNASTVRVRPENVGLVPTETAAG